MQMFLFALLPLFFILIEADSDCNYFENLETEKTYYAYNSNYPNLDYGQMHCKWQMVYSGIIKINCSFDIPAVSFTNCISDSLSIKFAEENIVHKYCDSNTLDIEGVNATINFDLSNISKGSKFLCEIRAEKQFDENNCKCGWKKVTRIVGGTETGINEYPMMCGLVDSINEVIFCGCTIISNRYVLTAAHCLENKDATKIGVVVGEHDVTRGNETNATKLFRIINCKMHPDYEDIHNDLAVCKINDTIEHNNNVGPVCLPFQHKRDSFGGVIAEALGWGLLEFGGEKAKKLQKVSLNVIQNEKCRQSIPKVTNKNLCTFTPGKDTCQMDSGGPLLWQNPTTQNLILIGITSSGFGCASDEPAVETRVGAYIDWIKNVTLGEQYCKIE
ncbi:hypothetical protein ACFW04_010235 [Cataglyphis niger]